MVQDALLLRRMVGMLTNGMRLKLVGLLALEAYSLEELASSLDIKISLAERHLRKLRHVGLIEVRYEEPDAIARYTLNLASFNQLKRSWYGTQKRITLSHDVAIDGNAFGEKEREVITRFFVGTRLRAIPAGRKNLEIIVKWFASLFEFGVSYQEKEVNEIIQRHYDDYAFFKKDLVGRGYLRREHSIFWRTTAF